MEQLAGIILYVINGLQSNPMFVVSLVVLAAFAVVAYALYVVVAIIDKFKGGE